jgi:hypothetical protein
VGACPQGRCELTGDLGALLPGNRECGRGAHGLGRVLGCEGAGESADAQVIDGAGRREALLNCVVEREGGLGLGGAGNAECIELANEAGEGVEFGHG